jgi:hypothetical protein
MHTTRRELLLQGLLGAGWLGLRSLATGLPAAFLLRPAAASADGEMQCADPAKAQFLILSMSAQGDPVNANVPGTYDFADIAHSADPAMAKSELVLGAQSFWAARPWAGLPDWVRGRLCFFHHATLTNNHPNLPKVMRLMGATARQEMLPSIIAKATAPCLGTVQVEPISVGAGEILTFEGRGLPNLNPTGLRDVLTHPAGPLFRLHKLRDQSLDKLHATLKNSGTPEKRGYLDRFARSRSEARQISDQLLSNLASITSDRADGQVAAAATLIKMNVAPVVAVSIGFGADNHSDPDLSRETAETQAGVAAINLLAQKLTEYQLEDRVTFAMLNVFGRTLKKLGTRGRDHWASHHTTVMFGKAVRPGVVGGLAYDARIGDYSCLPIDSTSGRGMAGADIGFEDTLGAVGKTMGAAVGLSSSLLDAQISRGKIVRGTLV